MKPFCVTGPLWGESTCYRWIPLTNPSDAVLWCFLWSTPEQTFEQTLGDLRSHHVHYDVTLVIFGQSDDQVFVMDAYMSGTWGLKNFWRNLVKFTGTFMTWGTIVIESLPHLLGPLLFSVLQLHLQPQDSGTHVIIQCNHFHQVHLLYTWSDPLIRLLEHGLNVYSGTTHYTFWSLTFLFGLNLLKLHRIIISYDGVPLLTC